MIRHGLRLADGRRIEYAELGDPAGVAAIYLHGTPSSASEARSLDAAARLRGVRLVSLDRPGYLRSDPNPRGSLIGVAEDVLAVADELRLGQFAVVGFSGGAGYALATASVAADRVTVVHIGGGLCSLAGEAGRDLPWRRRLPLKCIAGAPVIFAPLVAGAFRLFRRDLARRLDSPAEAATWFFKGPARGAQISAVAQYVRTTAPEDLRDDLTDHAAGTRATRAIVDDLRAYVTAWPFDLSALTARVELWHGRNDPVVPVVFAERMASELPNAALHVFDGEGHFVFHTHVDDIAASIQEHGGD